MTKEETKDSTSSAAYLRKVPSPRKVRREDTKIEKESDTFNGVEELDTEREGNESSGKKIYGRKYILRF